MEARLVMILAIQVLIGQDISGRWIAIYCKSSGITEGNDFFK